jgi:hypothetical protein
MEPAKLTVVQLRKFLQDRGVQPPWKLRKRELIELAEKVAEEAPARQDYKFRDELFVHF